MEVATAGAEQLKDWARRRGLTQREVAGLWGWDESRLSRYFNGSRTPKLSDAVFIEKQTGIPVESWTSSSLDSSRKGPISKRANRKI